VEWMVNVNTSCTSAAADFGSWHQNCTKCTKHLENKQHHKTSRVQSAKIS